VRTIFIVSVLVLIARTVSVAQSVSEFEWLIGSWVSTEGTTVTTEHWKQVNDSTLAGSSETLKDGKKVFEEKLSVEVRNGIVNYVAVLPFKTGVFQLSESRVQTAVFVDPKNDFPSTIHYSRHENMLRIVLKGDMDGQPAEEVLELVR
jgi:hypothetical protein